MLQFMGSQRVRHEWATEVNGINNVLSKHSTEHFPPVMAIDIFLLFPSHPSSFRDVKDLKHRIYSVNCF